MKPTETCQAMPKPESKLFKRMCPKSNHGATVLLVPLESDLSVDAFTCRPPLSYLQGCSTVIMRFYSGTSCSPFPLSKIRIAFTEGSFTSLVSLDELLLGYPKQSAGKPLLVGFYSKQSEPEQPQKVRFNSSLKRPKALFTISRHVSSSSRHFLCSSSFWLSTISMPCSIQHWSSRLHCLCC